MDYHDDTLTNAHRNRAASRKLFEHWNNANGNGRLADEFSSSATRIAQLAASNPISTLQSIQQPFPSSQFTQHSSPSSKPPPMTTTNIFTNGGTAATSFESNGGIIGHHQPQQQHQIPPQQSNNILLHRSPSGAQRKIRQKAQQQQNNGFIGVGGGQQQQNIPQQQQQMAYRNLIRENGYRSILGEEMDGRAAGGEMQMPPPMDSNSPTLSVGQLIDRMNRLDTFPKPMQSIDSSTSWLQSTNGCNSIDKMPAFSSLDGQQHSSVFPFSNKPTVQVHPLPIPPRHRSMSVISSCSSISQKPIPPPLPPKKHSLMASSQYGKRIQQQQSQPEEESTKILSGPHWQSSVLSSSSQSSISHSQSSSTETEFPGFSKQQKQLTEENNNSGQQFIEESVGEEEKESGRGSQQKPIVEPRKDLGLGRINSQKQQLEYNKISAKPTPFYSPPPSLSSSPSLASLQNSLHFAIENPEKHSCEQLQELDQRRLQSIESLGKKAAEREQDRQLLCRDLEEVGQLKATLFARISQNRHNSELLNRLNLFLIEVEKMTELEVFLHCQLARLGETTKITRKEELAKEGLMEEERAKWEKRLREQINDLQIFGGMLAARERQLDAEMAEELGDAEALHEWIFCKEQLGKLSAEKRQLEERLRDVRNLIDSLEAICLCPPKSE